MIKCQECRTENSNTMVNCEKCGASLIPGVIFCTGICGCGKLAVLQKIQSMALKCGFKCQLYDVGTLMEEFAHEIDPDEDFDMVLSRPKQELVWRRAAVFKEIINSINTSDKDVVHLVNSHACLRPSSFLVPGFDPHYLFELKDRMRMFVTIIDDVHAVKQRMKAHRFWRKRKMNNLEIAIWRDEEILLTDMIADAYGKKSHYVVACAEPPETLFNLIWHPEMKKAYLSFPVTAIQKQESAFKEISSFRDRIRRYLVVFDPMSIKDYDLTYKKFEMQKIRKELGEQTVDRDFRFIDQSNMIIAYFPKVTKNGREITPTSSGSEEEMRHAKRTGKDRYLYHPEKDFSPFFPEPTKHFRKPQELEEFLKKVSGEGKETS